MSVSFEEIGQTVATFQLESGLAVGQVCKITANGKAGACSEGDDFCGVILSKNGDYGAVAVRGFVALPYSGETAPTVGYCALAVLAAVVTCIVFLLQKKPGADPGDREIRVTVPENLDYNELFADLFASYTRASQLVQVKTVSMGALYRLDYQVQLLDVTKEKELLDAMRCRNGNLEISCGIPEKKEELL